jgi:hypothetical protein
MNTLRLSTFSLTIVLFTIGALVLPVNTALAHHCKGKHKNDPGCDDPGGNPGAIVYTAELTEAFVFKEDVTLNSKENQLKSEFSVTITRPESDDPFREVWDDVFSNCPNFFVGPTPVEVLGFTAPPGKKGWTIDKPGGVRVNFRGIPFPNDSGGFLIPDSAWVNLALIGEIDFSFPFPPSEVTLSHFQIYGQTESGVTPRLACTDANFETEELTRPITLTLTTPKEP